MLEEEFLTHMKNTQRIVFQAILDKLRNLGLEHDKVIERILNILTANLHIDTRYDIDPEYQVLVTDTNHWIGKLEDKLKSEMHTHVSAIVAWAREGKHDLMLQELSDFNTHIKNYIENHLGDKQ